MYVMSEAVKIADEICEKKEVRRVMIFTDSEVTLRRIQSDEPGPEQVLALRTMNWESELTDVMARLHVTCPGPGNTRFI